MLSNTDDKSMNPTVSSQVLHLQQRSSSILPEQTFLPEAYRLPDGSRRGATIETGPRVVFIEVTNRCNLLCQTCPHTYFDREPLKSLSLEGFIRIAEQFPNMKRVLLHGVGEPLLNRELPEIIQYLKGRDVEVIINSNGTLLTPKWQEQLIKSGLDQYRCSIDGAKDETYARIRGANLLPKLRRGLEGLVNMKERPPREFTGIAGVIATGSRPGREGSLYAAPGVFCAGT